MKTSNTSELHITRSQKTCAIIYSLAYKYIGMYSYLYFCIFIRSWPASIHSGPTVADSYEGSTKRVNSLSPPSLDSHANPLSSGLPSWTSYGIVRWVSDRRHRWVKYLFNSGISNHQTDKSTHQKSRVLQSFLKNVKKRRGRRQRLTNL